MFLELADIGGSIHQVSRLATFHLPAFRSILVQDVVQNRLFDFEVALVRLVAEDVAISVRRRRLDARSITHAAQEGLVGKIVLVKVCRENNELLERHFYLLSGV